MYIVPKKANDMMNVGMLECYTVTHGFKPSLLYLVSRAISFELPLTRRMYRPFSGEDSSFRPADYAGKIYYGCQRF